MKIFQSEKALNNMVEEVVSVLRDCGYLYTRAAIRQMLREWDEKKAPLFKVLQKMPGYVEGKYYAVVPQEVERIVTDEALNEFSTWLINNGYPIPHMQKQICNNIAAWVKKYHESDITEEAAQTLTTSFHVPVNVGNKTARAIQKILKAIGFDTQSRAFSQAYANYADTLAGKPLKKLYVVSLNPIDYLLMSNGNSWASCHTIIKRRESETFGHNGVYASGTISYMLDGTTFISYGLSATAEKKDLEHAKKHWRQCIHYDVDTTKLIMSRLYPQDNDGDAGISQRTANKNTFTPMLSEALGIENPDDWLLRYGRGAGYYGSFCVESQGTQYVDPVHFKTYYGQLRGHDSNAALVMGAPPICIECGDTHDRNGWINCCHETVDTVINTLTGDTIDINTAVCINNQYYRYYDCVRCSRCGDYELIAEISDGKCRKCIEREEALAEHERAGQTVNGLRMVTV